MRNQTIKLVCLFVILSVAVAFGGQATPVASHGQNINGIDWAPVEKAIGVHGETSPDGTVKFSIPRNITVMIDGVKLAPGADMSSDFNFMRAGNETLMVGEIMLTEEEVAATTEKLARAGIDETGLHNHLLRESPHIMWLHVHGHGDAVEIAKALHDIVEANGGIFSEVENVQRLDLDMADLDRAMGSNGTINGGVYAYSIPRADPIYMNEVELAPGMDISTEISFQPLGNGKAAAIGEFVLEPVEVEPVLHSLSGSGIEVTALHSHMITEEPRLFYLHCWTKGDALNIAQAMHEALSMTNSKILR